MPTTRNYSPYFSTIYDESAPVGNLGRGTHYSILRCAEWFDVSRKRLEKAQTHDFAVVWDEDHDTRVIYAIEQLYFEGLLAPVQFIGERKAHLTIITAAKFYWSESQETINSYIEAVSEIADGLDFDCWHCEVGSFDRSIPALGYPHQYDSKEIIADSKERVELYLRNIDSLWKLGTKPYQRVKLE